MRFDAIVGHGVFEVGNGTGASDIARLAFLRNVDPNIHECPQIPFEESRPFAEAFVEFYINTYGGVMSMRHVRHISRKRETDLQCLFSRSSERLGMNTAWRIVNASVKNMLRWDIETSRRVLFLMLQADYRLHRQDDHSGGEEDDTVRQIAAGVVKRALIEASHKLVTEPSPRIAAGVMQDIELLLRLTVSREATADMVHAFVARRHAVHRELDRRGQTLHRLFLRAQ